MQSDWLTRGVTPILILAVLAGCGGGDGTDEADEAENVWSLSDQPIYSVSESEGDPAFIIHQAWSGMILENGTAVIGNAGSRHLIFFDTLGTALRVVGGTGGGPGEFAGQMWISAATESGFTVNESSGRRVSFFTSTGDFQNSITIPSPPGGSVFGYLHGSGVVTSSFNVPEGEARTYNVVSDLGESVATLAGAPQPPTARISWMGVVDIPAAAAPPGAAIGPREISINTTLPLGCAATADEVTIGEEIFAMDAVNGVISAYTREGESRTVFTAPSRVEVTAELHEAIRVDLAEMGISSTPIPADTINDVVERYVPVGAQLPAWTSMIADPSGRLWLRSQRCPSVTGEPEEYEIITLEGVSLGRISIAGSRRVNAVRGDWVLVVRTDEFDVEHLELYRLENAAAS